MHTDASNDLKARVEKLERENRRLKRGGLFILSVVGAVVLMGQATRLTVLDEIRTRKLVVLDEAGAERAALGMDKDGPKLAMVDAAGKKGVVLGTRKNGAGGLVLFDARGNSRAALAAEGPGLVLYDEAEKTRVSLVASADGPTLALFDKAGVLRTALGMDKDFPTLILLDEAQKVRVTLATRTNGPELRLADARGFQAALGATELVSPKTGTTSKRCAASFVMFDKETNVIWQAP